MDTHRTAALLRTKRGLAPEQVASALGVPAAAYEQWERDGTSPWRPAMHELASLAGILTAPLQDLLGSTATTATETLQPLWAHWGTSGAGQRAALAEVTSWARVDDRVSAAAQGDPAPLRDSVAARGIPESRTSVFDECVLPLLALPVPASDTYVDAATQARDLAADVAHAWRVAAGDIDPWKVADTFGIPAGLAPLGEQMFAATIRIGAGYAVVVNSDVTEQWRTNALTHALVHLTFGHPALGSWEPIPDRDDDSIYACVGWDHRVCGLLEHVATWLTDPAFCEGDLHEAREGVTAATEAPSGQGPVRGPGEQPGYWEAFNVHVRPVTLRRELGLTHECLVTPGAGESRWPASLARRWVAATARGHDLSVRAIRSFPFGAPGCPSVPEVESAIYQGKVVAAQLAAWNQAQFDGRNSL